jgi:hypothetical protein
VPAAPAPLRKSRRGIGLVLSSGFEGMALSPILARRFWRAMDAPRRDAGARVFY